MSIRPNSLLLISCMTNLFQKLDNWECWTQTNTALIHSSCATSLHPSFLQTYARGTKWARLNAANAGPVAPEVAPRLAEVQMETRQFVLNDEHSDPISHVALMSWEYWLQPRGDSRRSAESLERSAGAHTHGPVVIWGATLAAMINTVSQSSSLTARWKMRPAFGGVDAPICRAQRGVRGQGWGYLDRQTVQQEGGREGGRWQAQSGCGWLRPCCYSQRESLQHLQEGDIQLHDCLRQQRTSLNRDERWHTARGFGSGFLFSSFHQKMWDLNKWGGSSIFAYYTLDL